MSSKYETINKWPNIKAVDFDGTLCENKWPDIGEPNQEVILYILEEQRKGAKLILWTNRTGCKLNEAIDWCAQLDIYFDAVNESLPEVLEYFGGIDSRKITADEYIDDKACTKFKLPYIKGQDEKPSKQTWAEREIAEACKREHGDAPDDEWDYGCACYQAALTAFKSLMGLGISGCGIGFVQNILNDLIDGKPLFPIIDTPDVWSDMTSYGSKDDKFTAYQCKRYTALFKNVYPDGRIEYSDVGSSYCVNSDNPSVPFTNGFIQGIIDEMYPVKMPYLPGEKMKVVVEDCLTDAKNGDFDTIGVLYGVRAGDKRVDINRFFKEGVDKKMVEICKAEYEQRKKTAKALKIATGIKESILNGKAKIGVDLASGNDMSSINGKIV